MNDRIESLRILLKERVERAKERRLLAIGAARANTRRNGVSLPGAPTEFPTNLRRQLLAFSFGALSASLRLRQVAEGDSSDGIRIAFEAVGDALSAAIENDRIHPDSGFLSVIAAAAYQLGRYSARAYFAIPINIDESNLSPPERLIALLIRRDFSALRRDALAQVRGSASDEHLESLAKHDLPDLDEIALLAVAGAFARAISEGIYALETGDALAMDSSRKRLIAIAQSMSDLGFVSLWWDSRIALELLDDLWQFSLHQAIPPVIAGGTERWPSLRSAYISALTKSRLPQIELWPSQMKGVSAIFEDDENVVVALPTGAGKTRIAELAILKNMSASKRSIYLTPLKSLSSQVEQSLRAIFGQLGVNTTALYSAIGASYLDLTAAANADISVMTPEKFDFMFRSVPDLLDDVGLIILDEGHMIGNGEREIRYEMLVQRLRQQENSTHIRLVCLSAALPSGDDLDDFVAWITGDVAGHRVNTPWRPTRLRFGQVTFTKGAGRLMFSPNGLSEDYFVPNYIRAAEIPTPAGRSHRQFPRSKNELTLACAWRLSDSGESTLIYAPLKASVERLGKEALEAIRLGALPSWPIDQTQISRAVRVGTEWLGSDHVAVKCLQHGIALHHADLPSVFQAEIESLIRSKVARISIASPTLAQGLNIAVSSIVFSSIYRMQKILDDDEFLNVCGRAGRPYASSEGRVIFPIMSDDRVQRYHLQSWWELIRRIGSHGLKSGLIEAVSALLALLARQKGIEPDALFEYVLGVAATEELGRVLNELDAREGDELIDRLDEAIIALLGGEDIELSDVVEALDRALDGSLWQRELSRRTISERETFEAVLHKRAENDWKGSTPEQRNSAYLSGLPFRDAIAFDSLQSQLQPLLVSIEAAISDDRLEALLDDLTQFAELAFSIRLFRGRKNLPNGWRNVLHDWVGGIAMGEILSTRGTDAAEIVRELFQYRLIWALEAVRSNATELELTGRITSLVDGGVPNLSSALLVRMGLTSRLAAIAIANRFALNLATTDSTHDWLESAGADVEVKVDWPSVEARLAWREFWQDLAMFSGGVKSNPILDVRWLSGRPEVGVGIILAPQSPGGEFLVFSNDLTELGITVGADLSLARRQYQAVTHAADSVMLAL